ncbi:MAG: PSD1 and planctomycete cytochrome C domain-containing protein [Pirellulaceae bacterium]
MPSAIGFRVLTATLLRTVASGVLIVFGPLASCHLASTQPPVASSSAPTDPLPQPTPEGIAFFETKIWPVLVEHCLECHGSPAKGPLEAGLSLASAAGIATGGSLGPAIDPKDPANSLLIKALRYDGLQMPPDQKLDAQTLADFQKWIDMGAPNPRQEEAREHAPGGSGDPWQSRMEEGRSHWAVGPLQRTPAPEASPWSREPLDGWIESSRREAGVEVQPEATRAAWLRRLSFDLLGLPPDPQTLDAFLVDERPDAYERMADQMLAHPAYAQRAARQWLDLARYADSNGADENHGFPVAWRYRDWVVSAINADMPYPQMVMEQIAGDLLHAADHRIAQRQLTATGFLVLGPKMLAEQDKPKMIADLVDEQVDTIGKVFLGMTFGCARCHDHKFDPISARDYYALAGILHSTRSMENEAFVSQWMERELPDPDKQAEIQRMEPQRQELQRQRDAHPEGSKERKEAEEKLKQFEATIPKLDRAMAVEEGKVKEVPVHGRGNHLQPIGQPVPRGVPVWLASGETLPMPGSGSGRVELAKWIADQNNALAWRVIANRLWLWSFQQPLVDPSSSFGLKASPPTHPKLLDWLALRLQESEGSWKRMRREMVLSATYRTASTVDRDAIAADPENRFYGRSPRRRMDAESVRDSLLALSGFLDRSFGGPPADWDGGATGIGPTRRTLYASINRAALNDYLATFDYVEPGVAVDRRPQTTVPHQSLFLMNHPLPLQCAERLGEEAAGRPPEAAVQTIQWMGQKIWGRALSDHEANAIARIAMPTSPASESDSPVSWTQADWVALVHALILAPEFLQLD